MGVPAGGAMPFPPVYAFDPGLAHQPFHPFAAHPDVLTEFELSPDSRAAIGAPRLLMDLTDRLSQTSIFDVASARVGLALPPLVEAGSRHLHHPSTGHHRQI